MIDCSERLAKLHAGLFPAKGKERPATAPELADNELLEKARQAKNGTQFSRLYDRGDWKGAGYKSHSEGDQALCNMLAFWVGNDSGKIDAFFRQSAMYRDKWEREDYRQRTIGAAVAATSNVYAGGRKKVAVSPGGPMQSEQPEAEPAGVRCNFRLAEDGVYYQAAGSDKKPLRICGRLEIVAITRDAEGTGWGWLLRWVDREGHVHEWAMPASSLAGDLIEVRSRLLDGGLTISSARGVAALLSEYIQTAAIETRMLCVSRLGWHGDSFVLANETIGPAGAERVLFQTQHESENYFGVAGSITDWRENVGQLCAGNSRLVMAVSCAFAGPVLSLVGAESGGIHLVGATSTGKSTALVVCGSCMGGGGRNGSGSGMGEIHAEVGVDRRLPEPPRPSVRRFRD